MSNAVDHDNYDVPMSADADDVAYGGSRFTLIPSAAGLALTGIDPSGIAGDGREIVIVNGQGTQSINLLHNSAQSSTGNRLFFSDGLTHVLAPFEMVWAVRVETVSGRVGWWVQF